jgi:hypothetical protein
MFIAIASIEASPVVPELQLRHTLQLDTIRWLLYWKLPQKYGYELSS